MKSAHVFYLGIIVMQGIEKCKQSGERRVKSQFPIGLDFVFFLQLYRKRERERGAAGQI